MQVSYLVTHVSSSTRVPDTDTQEKKERKKERFLLPVVVVIIFSLLKCVINLFQLNRETVIAQIQRIVCVCYNGIILIQRS